jgi:hypothetical protein
MPIVFAVYFAQLKLQTEIATAQSQRHARTA